MLKRVLKDRELKFLGNLRGSGSNGKRIVVWLRLDTAQVCQIQLQLTCWLWLQCASQQQTIWVLYKRSSTCMTFLSLSKPSWSKLWSRDLFTYSVDLTYFFDAAQAPSADSEFAKRPFALAKMAKFAPVSRWLGVGESCEAGLRAMSFLTGETLALAKKITAKRLQKEQRSEERRQRRHLESQEQKRRKLIDFLQTHNFDLTDVNPMGAQESSCFGLKTLSERLLHKSFREDNIEVVPLLLQFGADPICKDSRGQSAFDYVQSSTLCLRMKSCEILAFQNARWGCEHA